MGYDWNLSGMVFAWESMMFTVGPLSLHRTRLYEFEVTHWPQTIISVSFCHVKFPADC